MGNFQDQVEILKHVDTLIGNAALPEKSRLRREGMRQARLIIREQADILSDKAIRAERAGVRK